VVFVFPALVFAGVFNSFQTWGFKEYCTISAAVLGGGILGIVLTGFLRRPMIEEAKELRYPEGVATAEILKTGMAAFAQGNKKGILDVVMAFSIGVVAKVCSSGVQICQETTEYIFKIRNAIFGVGADLSTALIGVGFIIEFNGAFLVALGGALAWLVFVPIFSALNPASGDVADVAYEVWKDVRFIGVGGMIVGGLWSIFEIRQQLYDGIRNVIQGLTRSSSQVEGNEQDLSQTTIWAWILIGCAIAGGVYFASLSCAGAAIAFIYTLVAVFFFIAISVYIVGLIGSTNQPVSGITICTFLLAALCLLAFGQSGDDATKNVILIAGVVCLAVCLSGTAAQNFKTASIVGGSPKSMQTGLLISVVLTAFLAAPLLQFLDKAYVIGSNALTAPQAKVFAAMARGIFDKSYSLPWHMVEIGIVLGIAMILLGIYLKKKGSSFGISPMAVSVGIYLPFSTTVPILLGGIIHLLVKRSAKSEDQYNTTIQKGTVFAAGLVAGEAIIAIVFASLIFTGKALPLPLIDSAQLRSIFSLALLIIVPCIFYHNIRKN